MKIFLSWSGQISYGIAKIFHDWIPSVIQSVETFLSSEDIRKGSRWAIDIAKELNESTIGILFIVPGNHNAPWLNLEAGAISKSIDSAYVIPLLIGVERSALEGGPLSQFQSALFNKKEIYRVLETINNKLAEGKLPEKRLNEIYQVWWPKLEKSIDLTFQSSDKRGLQDAEANAKMSIKPEFDELEEKILLLLSELRGTNTAEAAVLANLFEISEAKAQYYLDELVSKTYAADHLIIGRPKGYSLAHKGREYLGKTNLIK